MSDSGIHDTLRAGTWIAGQQQRLRLLAPGTWQQDLASMLNGHPRRPDVIPGHPAVEIAIYPDVVWIAARTLQPHSLSSG